ncbi:copper resistance D family protein [Paludibacterium purpuratum]|uniref:Putative copper export protein n=1 Tax=Paludibacterium purpuratum TaxID=1144873 RepID=A0A4R7AZK9_9NEIS|nr:CopD family protein [Paludibacterium purpuratum]TDR73252.1 putative copper export protein [Paludibacterium purpuratum]
MTELIDNWGQPAFAALLDAGIALLAAGLLLGPTAPQRRAAPTALIGGALLGYVALATINMTDTALSAFPAALGQVLWHTHFGRTQLLAFAAWGMLCLAGNRRSIRWVAVLTLIVARAATGHAADAGWVSPALLVQTLHLSGMAAWAGTVFSASLHPPRRDQATALGQRLSSLAGWSLGLIVLTGVWNLTRITHDAPWQANADYTGWLLAKGGLIGLAVTLGALNRWRYLPHIARLDGRAHRRFWQILRLEGLLLTVVLLLAARLAVTMPG